MNTSYNGFRLGNGHVKPSQKKEDQTSEKSTKPSNPVDQPPSLSIEDFFKNQPEVKIPIEQSPTPTESSDMGSDFFSDLMDGLSEFQSLIDIGEMDLPTETAPQSSPKTELKPVGTSKPTIKAEINNVVEVAEKLAVSTEKSMLKLIETRKDTGLLKEELSQALMPAKGLEKVAEKVTQTIQKTSESDLSSQDKEEIIGKLTDLRESIIETAGTTYTELLQSDAFKKTVENAAFDKDLMNSLRSFVKELSDLSIFEGLSKVYQNVIEDIIAMFQKRFSAPVQQKEQDVASPGETLRKQIEEEAQESSKATEKEQSQSRESAQERIDFFNEKALPLLKEADKLAGQLLAGGVDVSVGE